MKKLSLFLSAMLLLAACSKYDDSAIKKDIADLRERLEALEALCERINQNAVSMQSILTALQARDAVTGVTPISENGKVIGYKISFMQTASVAIYNGAAGASGSNGADGGKGDTGAAGHTPVIGVKLFEGQYYWTVDGEYLTDGSGNKIRAHAQDGADGTDAAATALTETRCSKMSTTATPTY